MIVFIIIWFIGSFLSYLVCRKFITTVDEAWTLGDRGKAIGVSLFFSWVSVILFTCLYLSNGVDWDEEVKW